MVVGRVLALWVVGFWLACTGGAGAAKIESFEVRGWDIEAYSDDDTGAFSNCVAVAEYRSGMVLGFQIGEDFSWSMALFDVPVKLRAGQNVDVSFQIDRGGSRRISGEVPEKDFILVPLPDEVALFDQFRRGRLLRVQVRDKVASFDLDGTSAMLAALLECANRHQNTVVSNKEPARPSRGQDRGEGRGEGRGGGVSTGSGFFVNKDGVALTNAHVVEDCTDATIAGYGKARIVATDKTNDLALLKVTTPAATDPVRFRRSPLQLGETIYVMGFPLAGQLDNGLNFTSGIVSSLAGPANDSRSLQLTAPIQAGNSGGPITDASGLVVGVTQAKLSEVAAIQSGGAFPQNVNFGIKSGLAVNFLRANSIDPEETDTGEPLSAVMIAKEGRAYTVQVTCTPK